MPPILSYPRPRYQWERSLCPDQVITNSTTPHWPNVQRTIFRRESIIAPTCQNGSMTLYCRTVATPDGPFTVIASADAVLASGWTADPDFLLARLRPSGTALDIDLNVLDIEPHPYPDISSDPENNCLAQALAAVSAYYQGDGTPAQQVPTHQRATAFHTAVRSALHDIAYGHRITYTDLATAAGNPRAVRAAATVCSHNNTALFIPCHRVVRRDGTPGGFLYGTAIKQSLLAREACADPDRVTKWN